MSTAGYNLEYNNAKLRTSGGRGAEASTPYRIPESVWVHVTMAVLTMVSRELRDGHRLPPSQEHWKNRGAETDRQRQTEKRTA